MKRKTFFIFIFSLSILAASGQSLGVDILKFRRAFLDNKEKLLKVYNFRGAAFGCDYGDQDSFEVIITNFLKQWSGVSRKPALLFYSKTSDSLFSWMFSESQIYYHAQEIKNKKLIELENDLRASINVESARGYKRWKRGRLRGSNISLKKGVAKNWEKTVGSLTDILLPSAFRPHLQGVGHLFVLPELNIGQIPFWVLRPYENNAFLVDSMSYSIVPHVCQFNDFIAQNSRVGEVQSMQFVEPLVVGNPTYAPSLGLSPLAGAEAEAKDVAQLLGTNALVQAEATLFEVKNKMKESDLVYFATHAACSMENILDSSWIAFAPGGIGDGRLYLRQVQRMMVNGTMAVLSACQTGYGKVMEGGFVGLGRAFFKAGFDFTIMSLWSVNDESTSILMSEFMKGTLTPHYFQPAEPLRQAILLTRGKYPHPAFWSPFVLFGFTY